MYKIADWIDVKKLNTTELLLRNKHPIVNELILYYLEIPSKVNLDIIDYRSNHKRNKHTIRSIYYTYILIKKNDYQIFDYLIKTRVLDDIFHYDTSIFHNNGYFALDFLEKHPEKIKWFRLSSNYNSDIIGVFERTKNKIEAEIKNNIDIMRNKKKIKIMNNNLNAKKNKNNGYTNNVNLILQREVYENKKIENRIINSVYKKYGINNMNKLKLSLPCLARNYDDKVVDYIFKNMTPEHLEVPDMCTSLSLNKNTKIVQFLLDNRQYINWSKFSSNENDKAIEILKINRHKIDWSQLSKNTNDKAMELLEENPNNIDWYYLSSNPSDKALDLLEKYQEKTISTNMFLSLCKNTNPRIMKILEKNIKLLNEDICIQHISTNPNIFVYDYKFIYNKMWKENGIGQDLMKYFCNPLKLTTIS